MSTQASSEAINRAKLAVEVDNTRERAAPSKLSPTLLDTRRLADLSITVTPSILPSPPSRRRPNPNS